MKRIFTLLAVSIAISSFTIVNNIDEVISALKTGNAAQIAKYFDNTVEITLPDKSNSYSKSQAEMILKDFFSINNVKDFVIIHKGENAGSQYCIGTLVTKNASYRTTIFMKQKGPNLLIQELRFELR